MAVNRAGGNFRLSLQERINVVKVFYSSGCNVSRTLREYESLHHEKAPNRYTVTSIVRKFEKTGSVNDAAKSGRPRTESTEDTKTLLATAITQSPTKSVRRMSQEHNLSYGTTWRMLHEMDFKPYRPRKVQHLSDDDPDRRLEFCEIFKCQAENDPQFLDSIIWTDEAKFKLNGSVNRHNCYYWDIENPHHVYSTELNANGVMVWAGICSNGIIGPFFFPSTVTAASYEKLLVESVIPTLPNHVDVDSCFWQQDGAPGHYGTNVRNLLDRTFPNKWIGRRGPIEWPPRSPDLSPMDFFMWGYLRDKVYSTKPVSVEDLKERIIAEINAMPLNLVLDVCRSVFFRYERCVQANGEHFEHLKT